MEHLIAYIYLVVLMISYTANKILEIFLKCSFNCSLH